MDIELLLKTVDLLTDTDRKNLLQYLLTGHRTIMTKQADWKFDLFPGAIQTDDTFDDPLPDDFWFGKE